MYSLLKKFSIKLNILYIIFIFPLSISPHNDKMYPLPSLYGRGWGVGLLFYNLLIIYNINLTFLQFILVYTLSLKIKIYRVLSTFL